MAQAVAEPTATKGSSNIQVNLPLELKGIVESKAEESDKAASAWIRELVARELGYDLPPMTRERARKYATEDERKAANAARARDKKDAMTRLIEAAKSGDFTKLSDADKAMLGI